MAFPDRITPRVPELIEEKVRDVFDAEHEMSVIATSGDAVCFNVLLSSK